MVSMKFFLEFVLHGLLQVVRSDSSEESTLSLGEPCKSDTRTSELCSPVFKGVPARTPPSLTLLFMEFTCIMCQLLTSVTNRTIHKTAGLTVAGRSMILPGTIPSFHHSIPEAVNGSGSWNRSLRSFQLTAERWTAAL